MRFIILILFGLSLTLSGGFLRPIERGTEQREEQKMPIERFINLLECDPLAFINEFNWTFDENRSDLTLESEKQSSFQAKALF